MTTGTDWWKIVRPVQVIPRPAGVWWAKVPGDDPTATKGELCQEPTHDVYLGVRPLHATAPGCQGNEKTRTFFLCAVCYPPKDERGK